MRMRENCRRARTGTRAAGALRYTCVRGSTRRENWRVKCGTERMKQSDGDAIRTDSSVTREPLRPGPGSAGQSGDSQGLNDVAEAGPESVKELVEEGQSFEAEVISGVEEAPEPDVAEVHTRQFPEDDVPSEYRDTE